MATLKEIEATYDYVDELLRMSLGPHGDYTCALFNGDFSMTLEEAQKAKHEYILKGINFAPGQRILDVGSGWGPMLKAVTDAGGKAIGLTLSPAQAAWCKEAGLEARLQDWKTVDRQELGTFDGIVSVGAFEHFCSVEELLAGKQDQIYDDFFKFCYDLLPNGGRLFLQTMMWGGKGMPDYDTISVDAPKNSDEWITALVEKFFPGSWLPDGLDHITRTADPYFSLVSENNGQKDYIETLKRWGQAFYKPELRKLWPILKWIPRYISDENFRYQIMCLRYSAVSEVFKRDIFSHQRMVFEKKES